MGTFPRLFVKFIVQKLLNLMVDGAGLLFMSETDDALKHFSLAATSKFARLKIIFMSR